MGALNVVFTALSYLLELLSYLHETADNEVRGLSGVTGSWVLERDIAVEFFQMYLFGLWAQQAESHYVWENAEIPTADISKTRLKRKNILNTDTG